MVGIHSFSHFRNKRYSLLLFTTHLQPCPHIRALQQMHKSSTQDISQSGRITQVNRKTFEFITRQESVESISLYSLARHTPWNVSSLQIFSTEALPRLDAVCYRISIPYTPLVVKMWMLFSTMSADKCCEPQHMLPANFRTLFPPSSLFLLVVSGEAPSITALAFSVCPSVSG